LLVALTWICFVQLDRRGQIQSFVCRPDRASKKLALSARDVAAPESSQFRTRNRGKLSTENRSFVREYGSKAVFPVGALNREQLRLEYQQADLLCLPSLSDDFGHVVL
jgi:hypothetical protein